MLVFSAVSCCIFQLLLQAVDLILLRSCDLESQNKRQCCAYDETTAADNEQDQELDHDIHCSIAGDRTARGRAQRPGPAAVPVELVDASLPAAVHVTLPDISLRIRGTGRIRPRRLPSPAPFVLVPVPIIPALLAYRLYPAIRQERDRCRCYNHSARSRAYWPNSVEKALWNFFRSNARGSLIPPITLAMRSAAWPSP